MKRIKEKLEDLYTRYSNWANKHYILGLLIQIGFNAVLFVACLGIGLIMYDRCGWYKRYADSYPNLVRWIKHKK